MTIYHTSPKEIKEITKNGLFDDCLFFASEPYFMTQAENPIIYSLEIDESEIIEVSKLYEENIIKDISNYLEVDLEDAERVLDGRDMAFDYSGDCEDDWYVQKKQGECAKLMGYRACESIDEQGVVYIVPMYSFEDKLVRESI